MIFAMVVFSVVSAALIFVGLRDSNKKTESETPRKRAAV